MYYGYALHFSSMQSDRCLRFTRCTSNRLVLDAGNAQLDEANFKDTVLKSDMVWLVEFYAPWCGEIAGAIFLALSDDESVTPLSKFLALSSFLSWGVDESYISALNCQYAKESATYLKTR